MSRTVRNRTIVSRIFSSFRISKGDTVLDAYSGGGTTLIKARLDGYNSVGIDISPFSVFLTNTLTKTYDRNKLKKTIRKISHEVNPRVKIPDVAILQKSFSDVTLKYIYSLRDSINTLSSPEKDFFLFSLLSILDKASKAKKSGGFLRITGQKRVPTSVIKKLFIETSEKYINDLKSYKYSDASASAVIGDARSFPDEIRKTQYDAILTSPPYPNRHDYTRIYGLELLVGFIGDNQSLKALRYNTLRSHVEAKERYKAEGYLMPLKLNNIVTNLHNRKLNNPQIINTLVGYFEDMHFPRNSGHTEELGYNIT